MGGRGWKDVCAWLVRASAGMQARLWRWEPFSLPRDSLMEALPAVDVRALVGLRVPSTVVVQLLAGVAAGELAALFVGREAAVMGVGRLLVMVCGGFLPLGHACGGVGLPFSRRKSSHQDSALLVGGRCSPREGGAAGVAYLRKPSQSGGVFCGVVRRLPTRKGVLAQARGR